MAKKAKGHQVENIDSKVQIENVCIVCGAKHLATQTTYKNKDVIVSPPRCEKCQITHLLGLRMDKVITGLKHIGNLKSRIDNAFPTGKAAVLSRLDTEMDLLRDRFNSVTQTKTAGFNIQNAVKKTEVSAG